MNLQDPTLICMGLRDLLSELVGIPSHDPNRFESTDGYDDPNCTNGRRAAFAKEALDVFQRTCHMTEEVPTAAADLICDLLHLVHAGGDEPIAVIEAAIGHFVAEAGNMK
jgi:hypothetical protein